MAVKENVGDYSTEANSYVPFSTKQITKVPAIGALGAGTAALYTPEQNTAQAYNPSTDTSQLTTGSPFSSDRLQSNTNALAQLAAVDQSMERYPEPKYNPLVGDYGSIEADEYPMLQGVGNWLDKNVQTPLDPLLGRPFEGLSNYLRNFGTERDTGDRLMDAYGAALDIAP
jgi:hypothetical protein